MLGLTLALQALLAVSPAMTSQSEDVAAQLVRTVLEKQKDRPFWFRLRSIGFGSVPYVFDVTTRVVKYDGDGTPKARESGCVTRGVFISIEEQMFYTPLEGCGGTPVDARTRESFEERNREKLAKAKRRSEAEKAKIRAEEQKDRKERALFWDEFMSTFESSKSHRRPVFVMKTNEKYTAEYGNYRKFTTDVLIRVVGPEIDPEPWARPSP